MPLLGNLVSAATTAVSPYILYVKLFLIATAIAAVVGAGWYVKSVFDDRRDLLGKVAATEYALGVEQQRVVEAQRQVAAWQQMANDINKAVRTVKVQSDTYIQGVENATMPDLPDGTIVPFVLPASTAAGSLPRFANVSTGGKRAITP